jgi:hypothetical protein
MESGGNGGGGSGPNLVVNGDFETGDFTGWTTDSGSVTTGSTYAHSGTYGAEFGPVGSLGYLSQTLSTTPGTSYVLSFWLDSPDGENPNEFQVSWDGTTLLDEANIPAIGWTNIQFVVTATDTSTVLQFGFRDDPTYLGFDDVSVSTQSSTSLPPFTWTTNAGAITITGYTGAGGAVTIPDTINGYPVTSIGDYAFLGNTSLTSVTIGTNVTSIQDYAFDACSSLTSITIPSGVTQIGEFWVFGQCNSLISITVDSSNSVYSSVAGVLFDKSQTTLIQFPGGLGGSYTIPNSVASIGWAAFADSSLTNVTIPSSVTGVATYAFWDCNGLISIAVDSSNSAYSSVAGVLFDKSLTTLIQFPGGKVGTTYAIPNSVTSIGYGAFAGSSLASVMIPDGVTSIGAAAFFGCSSLTSVMIPNSVTGIGIQAFVGCYNLTSVYFQGNSPTPTNDLTVFSGDNTGTVYYLPGTTGWGTTFDGWPTVESGGNGGGQDFTYITNNGTITITGYTGPGGAVIIPSTINGLPVTSIGNFAFQAYSSLTSVTIPDGVTSIGSYAFQACSSLTSMTIPNSITSIGDWAFWSCYGLTNVTLSENLVLIGEQTFQGCTGLCSVAIPNGVINIGGFAFEGTGLTNIIIPSSVASIGNAAFGGCFNLTAITVDSNNPNYSSEGGVLFDKSQSKLIQYPAGNAEPSYTIPNNVVDIGNLAFYLCTNLIRIAIAGSVVDISSEAFEQCFNLSSVAIGDGVTSIGDWAFTSCGSLASVYFQGNSPTADSTVFQYDNNATAYYYAGTSGWGSTFGGIPAVMLAPPPPPNLLVNGGFESEPNWGNGIGVYDPGETELTGSQIPGWSIVTNHAVTVQIASGPYLTISGNYSVNTDGEGYDGNNSNFYQDFATQNGLSYALEFNWQSWGAYTTPTTSKLEISVVDTVTTAVLFDGLYSYDGSGPHPVHDVLANFTGTGNPLRLRIQETPQSGYNDNTFVVDNFSVTVAPGVGAPVPSGLVAWWPGDGNALDIAGGNNGTLVGGVTYANGEVGQAFDLDGTSGFVVAPASASLNVGLSSGLTVEGWIDPASTSTEQPIVEWNNGTNLGAHFWISAPSPFGPGPGCLYANLIDTTGGLHYFASPAGLITANTFQHVALTYDTNSGLAVLYINGASVAQQNLGVFTPQTSYNVYLGYRPGGAPITYWDGLLDEIRIYNRALSSNEIAAIYDAEKVSGQPVAPELSISISSGMGTTISGSGHFTLSSSPGVGSQPQSVVAADVNGDGRLDLIANGLVLTNNGSGGFGSNTTYSVGSSGSTCVVAADVNGDGKPDLITANAGSTTLTVLTNNGSGVFGSNATLDVNSTPQCVVAADVNGDGKPDLICVSSSGARFMTVFTNNGSGVFGLSSTPANGNARAFSIVAADINGDGKPDLITANFTTDTLTVFTNNGSGVFGSNATYTVGSQPRSVVAVDVNGDDKLDLISANSVSGTLTVLTNNGSGVFGSNATYNVGSQPRSVVAADVNGDGKVDLICANAGGGTLTVLTNNGSGAFGLNATYTVGNAPYSVVAADVNGDGLMDLVSANEGSGTLTVLTNTAVVGTGAFHNVVLSWPTNAPGFGLQQNFNLATTNWLDVTNTPIVTNDLNQVTLPAAGKNNFFQLFHQ